MIQHLKDLDFSLVISLFSLIISICTAIYAYIYHHNSLIACLTNQYSCSSLGRDTVLEFLISNVGNKPLVLTHIEIEITYSYGSPVVELPKVPFIIEPNKFKNLSFRIPFEENEDDYKVAVVFTLFSLKGKQYDLFKMITFKGDSINLKNYRPFKLKRQGSWAKIRWGL